MGNRYSIDLPEGWKGAFLVAWGRGLTVEAACNEAGVSVATVYRVKERDDVFRAEWDAARETRKLLRADKAWAANDTLVGTPEHPQHFQAVKLAIERNDLHTETLDRAEGANDDRIAEAIDRFTTLIGRLATRDVPQPDGRTAGGSALNP